MALKIEHNYGIKKLPTENEKPEGFEMKILNKIKKNMMTHKIHESGKL